MSAIGGVKREIQNFDFKKRIGIFEAKVIAVNPTPEQYKILTGRDLKEDSKECDYLGQSEEGNTTLRINVWLEDVKTSDRENPDRYKVSFYLENKEKESKDMLKKQYKNDVGSCTWIDDVNNLPEWFLGEETAKRTYRVAYIGEEELYTFLRTWLGKLDYSSAATTLDIEWKKLMKGNVKDIADQINGEFCTTFGALATVSVKVKDNEVREHQNVFNKAFLPQYSMKNFRLIDYSDPKVIEAIKAKRPKDQKPHEKFVLSVTGEYGCKDFYVLKDIKDYDPTENVAASDKVHTSDGDDY